MGLLGDASNLARVLFLPRVGDKVEIGLFGVRTDEKFQNQNVLPICQLPGFSSDFGHLLALLTKFPGLVFGTVQSFSALVAQELTGLLQRI